MRSICLRERDRYRVISVHVCGDEWLISLSSSSFYTFLCHFISLIFSLLVSPSKILRVYLFLQMSQPSGISFLTVLTEHVQLWSFVPRPSSPRWKSDSATIDFDPLHASPSGRVKICDPTNTAWTKSPIALLSCETWKVKVDLCLFWMFLVVCNLSNSCFNLKWSIEPER